MKVILVSPIPLEELAEVIAKYENNVGKIDEVKHFTPNELEMAKEEWRTHKYHDFLVIGTTSLLKMAYEHGLSPIRIEFEDCPPDEEPDIVYMGERNRVRRFVRILDGDLSRVQEL